MKAHRTHTFLAAGTFLTFGFASAIAVGAVPRDDGATPTRAAIITPHHTVITTPGHSTHHATAHTVHHRAAVTKQVATTTKHHVAVPAVATSTATSPPSPASPASPTTTPTTVATTSGHHHHHKAAPSTPKKPAKPTKHKSTKPKLAPRTTPSAAAVQAAIQGLKQYVHSFLTPTASQVAEFGDLVCSAYDDGNTTKQIEAKILQKVSSLPLTTILPGAADYVVRTAVKLYCPGYQSRLGSAAA